MFNRLIAFLAIAEFINGAAAVASEQQAIVGAAEGAFAG